MIRSDFGRCILETPGSTNTNFKACKNGFYPDPDGFRRPALVNMSKAGFGICCADYADIAATGPAIRDSLPIQMACSSHLLDWLPDKLTLPFSVTVGGKTYNPKLPIRDWICPGPEDSTHPPYLPPADPADIPDDF
jgi:hypothetical protein